MHVVRPRPPRERRRLVDGLLSEAAVEKVVLDRLAGLGYAIATDVEIGPDGKMPEREAYADVALGKRLISR
jgi:hypothetical protein